MNKSEKAQKGPAAVELEAGKKYEWCACGLSGADPFCDSSHFGTHYFEGGRTFSVEESGIYHLCRCKKTKNPPFCDGSHNNQ